MDTYVLLVIFISLPTMDFEISKIRLRLSVYQSPNLLPGFASSIVRWSSKGASWLIRCSSTSTMPVLWY